jgi:uncharacterized membrane protein YdjX (TVP38/TMEM64 family)
LDFSNVVLVSEYIKSYGSFALLLLFALIVVQCHIPVMPFGVVASVCGFIYGFKAGIAVSWISVVMGSIIAFYLYRFLKIDNLAKKILENRRHVPEELIFGFIVVAHNIPIIPIAVPNILASLSRISASRFIIATALGLLIPSISFVAFGSGIESLLLSPNYLTLLFIVIFLVVFYLLKKYSHKILELIHREK